MAFERLKVFLQDAATLTGLDTAVEKVSSQEFRDSVKKTVNTAYEREKKRQSKLIERAEEKQKEYEAKLENMPTERLKQVQGKLDSQDGNEWAKRNTTQIIQSAAENDIFIIAIGRITDTHKKVAIYRDELFQKLREFQDKIHTIEAYDGTRNTLPLFPHLTKESRGCLPIY